MIQIKFSYKKNSFSSKTVENQTNWNVKFQILYLVYKIRLWLPPKEELIENGFACLGYKMTADL